VRSRLDRRRSLKEAIKRRAVQNQAPPFTNDDLRYRQLAMRPPAGHRSRRLFRDGRVVEHDRERPQARQDIFLLGRAGDCAGSTRTSKPCSSRTPVEAWEFPEQEFFQVSGSGGTVASTAFRKVLEVATQRYDPGRFNTYVFYASDGANFHNDREAAAAALAELGELANYIGYVETASVAQQPLQSETALLFEQLEAQTHAAGRHALSSPESVWGRNPGVLHPPRRRRGLA
jgi:uncharacterized sporulation protein YeaH/YhbH (DUF444 family)